MAGQVEESDVAAGPPDLAGHGPPFGGRTLEEGREIDDGYFVQRNALAHQTGVESCCRRLLRCHDDLPPAHSPGGRFGVDRYHGKRGASNDYALAGPAPCCDNHGHIGIGRRGRKGQITWCGRAPTFLASIWGREA